MEDEPGSAPLLTAAEEAERRRTVLAERHRLRNRRRWITGAALVATTALVGAGAITAWNSQGHAEFAAAAIEQWRDDRDAAECGLTERARVAVRAEEQAREMLADARSIPAASSVYAEAERTAFGEDGIPLLEAMAEGTILDDTDRARASDGPEAFDMDACTTAARQARAPIGPATAETADALAREWRGLGAADDVDDARVIAFEAAVEQLGDLAAATATSRAEVATLRTAYQAAPVQAFDRFADIDAAITALLSAERTDAPSVLELVRALAERAGAAREVESLALAAEAEAAAAAAAAAAEAAAEAERARPPAVTRPAPAQPGPVQPPPQNQPVEPAPGVPVPSVPGEPAPTIPVPPEVTDPSVPAPTIPPEPEPPGEGMP